jgi:hypothetical protein
MLGAKTITDAFDFALEWPMGQVVCSSCKWRWEENLSSHSSEFPSLNQVVDHEQQVSDHWSFVLRSFQNSGKAEDEIREAARGLQALAQREETQNAIESNALFFKHLHKALSKVNKAHMPLKSSLIAAIDTCASDVTPTELQEKKRPSSEVSSASDQKRRKVGCAPHLPLELVAMIVSQMLVVEPRCALDLVVPDWRICHREYPDLEKSLKISRIVTYIRGTGFEVGSLSCNFEHGEKDHILTSIAEFDHSAVTVSVGFSSEYTKAFYRNHTHVFTLSANDLSGETVEDVMVSDRRDILSLRSRKARAILPFDDEPVDVIERRALPHSAPIYQHLRHIAVHSPLELMQTNAETLWTSERGGEQSDIEAPHTVFDLDRAAHLWLSWSLVPNLETVFLDLRIYSHDLNTERRCLSKFEIMDRAHEMARHLQLKTLMLAGLQSYSFQTEYEGVRGRHIEQWDEIDGEPNWIKIFRPAIRPGGKIVLVDRLVDNPSDWHARPLQTNISS